MTAGVDRTHMKSLPVEHRLAGLCLLWLMVVSALWMDLIPSLANPPSIVFALSFMALFSICLLSGCLRIKHVNDFWIWLLIVYSMLSCGIGYLSGHEAIEIAGGLLGVLAICSYFFMRLPSRYGKAATVERDVIFICLLWCLIIIIKSGGNIAGLFLSGGRLTYEMADSVLPFPLAGFALALFSRNIGWVARTAYCSVFFIMIVAVGYKAVILISLALILAYSMFYGKLRDRIISSVVIMLLALLGVFIFFSYFPDFVSFLELRIESFGGKGDQVRINEIKHGFELFLNSPIFGNGLGLSFNSDDYIYSPKSFIHNSAIYILAVYGLFGAFIYFCIFSGVVRSMRRGGGGVAFGVAILAVMASSLTAATFKLVQFNLLLGILLFGCLYPFRASAIEEGVLIKR